MSCQPARSAPCVEEIYGLRVQTVFPLAGQPVDEAPDLVLRLGEERACPPPRTGPGVEIGALEVAGRTLTSIVALDAGGWSLRFHGLAEAVVAAKLGNVVLHPDPEAPPAMLEVLAAGPVLATVLALKGVACLHASAVAFGGTATAFTGTSGAGKSTLAALCCGLGAELVADDILRLDLADEPPACIPGSREVRLRPGAAEVVAALASFDQRNTGDGRTAVLAGPASMSPVPLRAVIVPVLGADATEVRRLRGAEATAALLAAARVGSIRLDVVTKHALDLAVGVTATVPIWEVRLVRAAQLPNSLPRELIDLVGLAS